VAADLKNGTAFLNYNTEHRLCERNIAVLLQLFSRFRSC